MLNIHTNARGEIVEGKSSEEGRDRRLREAAREVDCRDNPYRGDRLGADAARRLGCPERVVIVPLRAYTAKAQILPEQTLGRGLRRMTPPGQRP